MPSSLRQFVQSQFQRGDCWCWETVIEEVAARSTIPLTPDRLTYASGTIRTGRFQFRRNNAAWRALCGQIISCEEEAQNVIDDVIAALNSPRSQDVAASWSVRAREAVATDAGLAPYVGSVLQWGGHVYRPRSAHPDEFTRLKSIVYSLWRLSADGVPAMPVPLYIGEARGTMMSRVEGAPNKCHRDWWGVGKPMGISICEVDSLQRVDIEERFIHQVVPFANVKGGRVAEVWAFQRP